MKPLSSVARKIAVPTRSSGTAALLMQRCCSWSSSRGGRGRALLRNHQIIPLSPPIPPPPSNCIVLAYERVSGDAWNRLNWILHVLLAAAKDPGMMSVPVAVFGPAYGGGPPEAGPPESLLLEARIRHDQRLDHGHSDDRDDQQPAPRSPLFDILRDYGTAGTIMGSQVGSRSLDPEDQTAYFLSLRLARKVSQNPLSVSLQAEPHLFSK